MVEAGGSPRRASGRRGRRGSASVVGAVVIGSSSFLGLALSAALAVAASLRLLLLRLSRSRSRSAPRLRPPLPASPPVELRQQQKKEADGGGDGSRAAAAKKERTRIRRGRQPERVQDLPPGRGALCRGVGQAVDGVDARRSARSRKPRRRPPRRGWQCEQEGERTPAAPPRVACPGSLSLAAAAAGRLRRPGHDPRRGRSRQRPQPQPQVLHQVQRIPQQGGGAHDARERRQPRPAGSAPPAAPSGRPAESRGWSSVRPESVTRAPSTSPTRARRARAREGRLRAVGGRRGLLREKRRSGEEEACFRRRRSAQQQPHAAAAAAAADSRRRRKTSLPPPPPPPRASADGCKRQRRREGPDRQPLGVDLQGRRRRRRGDGDPGVAPSASERERRGLGRVGLRSASSSLRTTRRRCRRFYPCFSFLAAPTQRPRRRRPSAPSRAPARAPARRPAPAAPRRPPRPRRRARRRACASTPRRGA